MGTVEDIEQGKVTWEKLYRVRYDDNDLEHLTREQVLEFQVVDKAAAPKGKAKAKVAAKVAASKQAEEKEEEKNVPILKKPAAAAAKEEAEEEVEEEDVPI